MIYILHAWEFSFLSYDCKVPNSLYFMGHPVYVFCLYASKVYLFIHGSLCLHLCRRQVFTCICAGVKYVAGGSSFLGALFNCLVHVCMYTYYALGMADMYYALGIADMYFSLSRLICTMLLVWRICTMP